jgi:hypothetical protein
MLLQSFAANDAVALTLMLPISENAFYRGAAMASNFGVSFKLRDIREVRERCIGSSLSGTARFRHRRRKSPTITSCSRLPCRAMDGQKSGLVVYP